MEISSRHQLAAALRSSNLSERQSLLGSLAEVFEEAQGHGKQVNQEAVDELYLCYRQDGVDRVWYAYLLLRLINGYSMEVARSEFLRPTNNKILLLAATHLVRLSALERIAFLCPLVMDGSNAARCRIAANMLDDCIDRVDSRVALRAALVSDHSYPVPPVNANTLEAWLGELDGPFPSAAKEALLRVGNDAFDFMLLHWDLLPEAVRAWVLRKASDRNIAGVADRLWETIRFEQGSELLIVALECIECLNLRDDALLLPLYDYSDELVRAAAIKVGKADWPWTERFMAEESDHVRLAILDQIINLKDAGYIGFLVRCLGESNWRVRARATAALASLAPASLGPMRAAMGDANETVRVAAAKGLYMLGQVDWVKASSC